VSGVRWVCALAMLLGAPVLLPGQPADAAQKSTQAKRAMLSGHYAEAVKLYRELLREMPGEPGLHLSLGVALEKAGQPTAAIPELESVTRDQPKMPAAWFLLGLAYAQLKRPGEAIAPLREAWRLDASNSQALLELADAELSSGDAAGAARDFGKLSVQHPDMPKAWEGVGLARLRQSEAAADAIEREDPESPWRFALLARDRVSRGELGEALRLYGEALQKKQDLPGAHAGRAAVYREMGRTDAAEQETAAETRVPAPSCSTAPEACLYRKGDFSAVAAQAHGHSPEQLYWLALAAGELAQQSFAHLAKLPPSPESHELLAESYQRSGKRLDAIAEWKKALALEPGNARVRGRLAESLYRAREYGEAESLLKPLVANYPENAEWQYLLGSDLFQQKRDDEALPHLREAARLQPNFLPVWENLGLAYLDMNEPEKAAECLEKARALDQGSISFALSNAYRRMGKSEEAREALARYRELTAKH
jgi:tetratricopeptide (TPR) repeat protein